MEVYVVRDAPLPLLLPTSVPPALAGMERCCWGTWWACPVSQGRQTVATPSSARSSPSCPGSQEPLSIQTLVTLVTVVLQEVGGRLTSGSLSLCSPPPVFLSSLPSESSELAALLVVQPCTKHKGCCPHSGLESAGSTHWPASTCRSWGRPGEQGRGSAGGLLWRAAFKLKSKRLKEPGEEGKGMRK